MTNSLAGEEGRVVLIEVILGGQIFSKYRDCQFALPVTALASCRGSSAAAVSYLRLRGDRQRSLSVTPEDTDRRRRG